MRMLWQQIPSSNITELLCSTKLDGICLDIEHGCGFTQSDIYESIRIITLYGKKAFCRLKDADNKLIGLCMDAGADGLIFANVNSNNYVNAINNSMQKQRSLGLTRNNLWGEGAMFQVQPVLIAQIESPEAIGKIKYMKSILDLGTLFSYYMIGPYDLSRNCGVIGGFDSPEFLEQIKQYEKLVPAKQRAIHIVKDHAKNYEKYKDYGCLAFGLDTLMIIDAVGGLNEYL